MRSILAFVGAGALVIIVLWAAASLLPACGANNFVARPWIDWCPVNTARQSEDRIAAISNENRELELLILQREQELGNLQCAAALPKKAANEPIDRKEWAERDIGLLDGCWDLDSRFVTRNRQTGLKSNYDIWTMCFDGSGNGREEMRAQNGNSCSGAVSGRFNADGALVIEEPGNLQCSDGGFIYRLRSTCQLNDNGTASCIVSQPEVGGSTNVEFRRSQRGR